MAAELIVRLLLLLLLMMMMHLLLLVVMTLLLLLLLLLLLFSVVDLICQFLNKRKRLPPFVTHEADSRLVDDAVEDHEKVVLEGLVIADKVVPQVVVELESLLAHVGEVDEEARAHIALKRLDLIGISGTVVLDEQVAILEESTAADLLRVPCGDHLTVQVVVRLTEVAVDGLGHHSRVERLADGHCRGAVVKEDERVENDLKRVDRELELAAHRVHKLELHILAAVVRAQRDQRPAIALRNLDHLGHVRFLERAREHASARDAGRQKVQQRVQHGRLDAVVGAGRREVHAKDEIQIVVGLRLAAIEGQHVRGAASVDAHVPNSHAVRF